MKAVDMEGAAVSTLANGVRAGHIKKRALRNKSLSVSFNEKDLRDFVTGFHKRKKKRRKEARQKQEEAERRKRIADRKRRKLEREYVIYGGAPPATGAESDGDDCEQYEGTGQAPSVSGMMLYDNGDVKVTVTTSEIGKDEEEHPNEKPGPSAPIASPGVPEKKNVPVLMKKPFKKAGKQRSHGKSHSKKDGKKGKRNNKKRR